MDGKKAMGPGIVALRLSIFCAELSKSCQSGLGRLLACFFTHPRLAFTISLSIYISFKQAIFHTLSAYIHMREGSLSLGGGG